MSEEGFQAQNPVDRNGGCIPVKELTPSEIVGELDRHIIGQKDAKRSVAIALRNRYRRQRLARDLRDEVVPKNILMIGPTGVGKTEIARRLARLVSAPFVKVEATKFTEVGYVGRDVESMIRDLLEGAIRMVKAERAEAVGDRAERAANARLVELLAPRPKRSSGSANPFALLMGGSANQSEQKSSESNETESELEAKRESIRRRLEIGELEDHMVEFEVEDSRSPMMEIMSPQGVEEMGVNLSDLLGNLIPRRRKKRKLPVREARKVLRQEEAEKLIDPEEVSQEAIDRVEQNGIVFIDEVDKIASKSGASHGPEVSREGVQRDILPIVEGSTVSTKYGPVKTDHILFIAAGAFHTSKPSDLIPELQGRFPIRVELSSLGEEDFERILTEPRSALVTQYKELLRMDGVELCFTKGGIREIARVAAAVNSTTEDIGARRLHTIMERLLDEVSFSAPDLVQGEVKVDSEYVKTRLSQLAEDQDLSRYIL